MEIKLDGWEIREAIKGYIEAKHNLEIEFSEMFSYPCLEYTEREIVHKKHKNGKVKKDKDGMWIIDESKTKYVTKYAEVTDESNISFFID